MKRKVSTSHDEAIIRRLRNEPTFAAEYLKAALEEEDEPRVLLIALRRLAQAQGVAKVAKAAGIERESLYRALSASGNPRLSTLVAVTRAIGLRLTVETVR
jgi:probable addiction module antidote protein